MMFYIILPKKDISRHSCRDRKPILFICKWKIVRISSERVLLWAKFVQNLVKKVSKFQEVHCELICFKVPCKCRFIQISWLWWNSVTITSERVTWTCLISIYASVTKFGNLRLEEFIEHWLRLKYFISFTLHLPKLVKILMKFSNEIDKRYFHFVYLSISR